MLLPHAFNSCAISCYIRILHLYNCTPSTSMHGFNCLLAETTIELDFLTFHLILDFCRLYLVSDWSVDLQPGGNVLMNLIFCQLFCCSETWEVHCAAMLNLRQRILPPNFLSESPKEAGFCLWLLHPDPCSRPKAR